MLCAACVFAIDRTLLHVNCSPGSKHTMICVELKLLLCQHAEHMHRVKVQIEAAQIAGDRATERFMPLGHEPFDQPRALLNGQPPWFARRGEQMFQRRLMAGREQTQRYIGIKIAVVFAKRPISELDRIIGSEIGRASCRERVYCEV